MNSLEINAYGKINLGLDIIRKLPNGYHEVNMIMQSVNLYDTIKIQKNSNLSKITITTVSDLPTNKDNLIYKAANLLIQEFHIKESVMIDLIKRIPIAAGMAGGSADAAATLMGMNQLFDLNLSTTDLMKRGVTLGADIPYCILNGTAHSKGIGEILTTLPTPPDCTLLIVKPPISVSTKYVYEHLNLDNIVKHPDILAIINAIKNHSLFEMAINLENILETVTTKKYPIIEFIKKELIENGAMTSLMSGSGPTVFGIFEKKQVADKAADKFKILHSDYDVFVTTFYNPNNLPN